MAPGQWPARLSGAVGNDVLVQPPLDRAELHGRRVGPIRQSPQIAPAHAVVEPPGHDRARPEGDVQVHQAPRSRRPTGEALRAGRPGARPALRAAATRSVKDYLRNAFTTRLPLRLRELPVDQLGARLDRLRSEEHTSELQSLAYLVCRLLLEKKKKNTQ